MARWCELSILILALVLSYSQAFSPPLRVVRWTSERKMAPDNISGSFFNPIPDNNEDEDDKNETEASQGDAAQPLDFDDSVQDLIRKRSSPPTPEPSTVSGVPTSKATGFGKTNTSEKKPKQRNENKPYVALGAPDKPVNDINNLEYDDQGYTLYASEDTGKKQRVFEALIDYPSIFTLKIIGADDGAFVPEIVQVVAESCGVQFDAVEYSTRLKGKWTSITVKAPVQSAEMVYSLYESIDRDPRVKFKF